MTIGTTDIIWWPKLVLSGTQGGPLELILYWVAMFLIGIPVFCLESYMSQYMGRGVSMCWEFARLFQGLGYSMLITTAIAGSFYALVIGWAIHYMFASWGRQLPWASCYEKSYDNTDRRLNSWNTEACRELADFQNQNITFQWSNLAGYEYFYRFVVGSQESMWHVQGNIVGYVFLSMIVVALALNANIPNISFFPVVVFAILVINLIALFIRGVTLEGATEGLGLIFKTPEWEKLTDVKIWQRSVVSVFYALFLSTGCIPNLAAHNRFQFDFVKSAFIIAAAHGSTVFFFTMIVACYYGAFAKSLNITPEELEGGVGKFNVYTGLTSHLREALFLCI